MRETYSKDMFEPISQQELEEAQEDHSSGLSFWQDAWRRLKQNKLAMTGLSVIIFLIIMAIVGPSINEYTYSQQNLVMKNLPPSAEYWFGSDNFGRDLFTRTWYGARISLFIGITAALIDLIIGVIWGGVAGYYGGKVDEVMMRFADILYGLPYILVVVLLMVVLGQGIFTIIIAMTVTGWVGMARIVRGEVLKLKEQEYVLASLAIGANFGRVLFKHLIPNALGPILVTLTLTIPSAIFTEAFLSFLGLGVQAPIASWGTMTSDGLDSLRYYPWLLFLPATFISITILAFNVLGDGLRDALDPRLRK